jgi:hypothetical protein
MKHSVLLSNFTVVIILLMPLLLTSCHKKIWSSPVKMEGDINGEPYVDNSPLYDGFGGKSTPWLSYDKIDNVCILSFLSNYKPKKHDKWMSEYSIIYTIFNFSLNDIGKKYMVKKISGQDYLVSRDSIQKYYTANKISNACIVCAGGDCFGEGYIMLTHIDNNGEWIKGEIQLQVKIPMEKADTLLNIKGEFNVLLDNYTFLRN